MAFLPSDAKLWIKQGNFQWMISGCGLSKATCSKWLSPTDVSRASGHATVLYQSLLVILGISGLIVQLECDCYWGVCIYVTSCVTCVKNVGCLAFVDWWSWFCYCTVMYLRTHTERRMLCTCITNSLLSSGFLSYFGKGLFIAGTGNLLQFSSAQYCGYCCGIQTADVGCQLWWVLVSNWGVFKYQKSVILFSFSRIEVVFMRLVCCCVAYAFAELIDNALAATANNDGTREIDIRLVCQQSLTVYHGCS